MNTNEYQNAVMRTCGQAEYHERLTMGAMGIAGEAGEICDLLKKHLFHAHGLDFGKTQEEIGDLMWYVALLCNTLGLTIENVMAANIEKLKRRYPQGFSSESSINRQE